MRQPFTSESTEKAQLALRPNPSRNGDFVPAGAVARATCMQTRSTQSRKGSRVEDPCRVQGQRPCWGLGQRPNQNRKINHENVTNCALTSAEQRSGRSPWNVFSAAQVTNAARATCMQKRSTPSRNGSRGDFVPFPVPCRMQGQRPCWGLGQRPNQKSKVNNADVPNPALTSAEQRSGRSPRNVFSAAQVTNVSTKHAQTTCKWRTSIAQRVKGTKSSLVRLR